MQIALGLDEKRDNSLFPASLTRHDPTKNIVVPVAIKCRLVQLPKRDVKGIAVLLWPPVESRNEEINLD